MKCKKFNCILIILAFIFTFNICLNCKTVKADPITLGLTAKAIACLAPLGPYILAGAVVVGAGVYAHKKYKEYCNAKMVRAMENFTSAEVENVNEWAETQDENSDNINLDGLSKSVVQKVANELSTEQFYDEVKKYEKQIEQKEEANRAKMFIKNSERMKNFPVSYFNGSVFNFRMKQYTRCDVSSGVITKIGTGSSIVFKVDFLLNEVLKTYFIVVSFFSDSYSRRYTYCVDGNSSSVDLLNEENFKEGTVISNSDMRVKGTPMDYSSSYFTDYPCDFEIGSSSIAGDKSICVPTVLDKNLALENDTTKLVDNVKDHVNDKDKTFEIDLNKTYDGVIDNPIDRPTDKPVDKPLSWEWLKNLLKDILDAIKSIPSLLQKIIDGIKATPTILKEILDWIKGIPARWSAFWSINWNEVFSHAQYGDIVKAKLKPFYDTANLLTNIKANPQSHSGKFYMKIPKEMGGNGQEQCVLDLSFGDAYFKIARNLLKAGMWVAFLFWILKTFKPRFNIGG